MVPKRPFRRPPLRPRPGRRSLRARPPVGPRVRRALARANRLMAEAHFLQAAGIFDDLARRAQERGMVRRAADLKLQASRAHLAADDVDGALTRVEAGLRLLIQVGNLQRVGVVLDKATKALRDKGYDAQAEALAQAVDQLLGEAGASLQGVRQERPRMPDVKGPLPGKCSGCGASVIPDEVEWHDAQTAECLYCGTILKTT